MVLFTLLAFAMLFAMVVGQYRIASRALRERKAGLGRFTYSFNDSPKAFIVVLVMEWLGLLAVFSYSVGLLAVVLVS